LTRSRIPAFFFCCASSYVKYLVLSLTFVFIRARRALNSGYKDRRRERHPHSLLVAMTRSQRSFFYPHTSISRLFFHLRLLFHLKASFQEVDLLSHTPNTPDQSAPTDPDALCRLLVELGRHLRPLLPSDREWLEEGAIEAVNNIPVDAGQVADVLVGMKGSLRVAIKHYRFHSSSNYLPAYVASASSI